MTFAETKNNLPHFHLFESNGPHLLIPDGSRIYGIDSEMLNELEKGITSEDDEMLANFLQSHGSLAWKNK